MESRQNQLRSNLDGRLTSHMNMLYFYKNFLRKVGYHLGKLAHLTGPAHLHRNSPLLFTLTYKANDNCFWRYYPFVLIDSDIFSFEVFTISYSMFHWIFNVTSVTVFWEVAIYFWGNYSCSDYDSIHVMFTLEQTTDS